MTAQELRQKFLDFFRAEGHTIIPSASLIPSETDPTVLFIIAGMQPFKQYYINPAETEFFRIASVQKCVRTVDIEEVGDKTHLTFFEMLGNFSFGYPAKKDSYFKQEALKYAWNFLTKKTGFEKSRIYATYFQGDKNVQEDKESLEILKKLNGLKKIKPQGAEDNFWTLGTEGSPGGPTVEFYVDGVEIWNCVFNEYVLKNGHYELSDNRGVDTGMGLERLLAVINNKETVFDTELFTPLFKKLEKLSGKKYAEKKKEFRIIADHIKAGTFIIGDGVFPSNKDRGYVLRRLIRRAIRYGKVLGIEENFIKQIAETVIEMYESSYPELKENREKILAEIEKEENKFRKTLKKGLNQLEIYLSNLESNIFYRKNGEQLEQAEVFFNSDIAQLLFDLYQTHGFPLELAKELVFSELEKKGIKLNKKKVFEKYDVLFGKHQALSRTAAVGKFKGGLADTGEETKKLHTAAHLMLSALRKVLGDHIHQKGSNIMAERLRFDFSHSEKLTDEQKKEVEKLVNEIIVKKLPITFKEMSLNEARKSGAEGVFDSKYGEKVKVYQIGQGENIFSLEICGGPHTENTGDLGKFKIIKEESSGAGVRRIKAILE